MRRSARTSSATSAPASPPALIFLDAFPDRGFRSVTGTVRPAVDHSKATATVKVEFRKLPQGVLPDIAANIAFLSQNVPPEQFATAQGRLRVPRLGGAPARRPAGGAGS